MTEVLGVLFTPIPDGIAVIAPLSKVSAVINCIIQYKLSYADNGKGVAMYEDSGYSGLIPVRKLTIQTVNLPDGFAELLAKEIQP